jgi:hypothetical protein
MLISLLDLDKVIFGQTADCQEIFLSFLCIMQETALCNANATNEEMSPILVLKTLNIQLPY